eukprot:7383977-Ditylum_brightwellii.AAC.1
MEMTLAFKMEMSIPVPCAQHLCTCSETQLMSGEGNGLNTAGKSQKQQGGTPLPFLDHDFASYHTTE